MPNILFFIPFCFGLLFQFSFYCHLLDWIKSVNWGRWAFKYTRYAAFCFIIFQCNKWSWFDGNFTSNGIILWWVVWFEVNKSVKTCHSGITLWFYKYLSEPFCFFKSVENFKRICQEFLNYWELKGVINLLRY